uniref:CUB domain-containing protein n=1 Tax=Strongyloides stercoralis TaxID=6248 RepID=A0A0K0EJQ9_STRER
MSFQFKLIFLLIISLLCKSLAQSTNTPIEGTTLSVTNTPNGGTTLSITNTPNEGTTLSITNTPNEGTTLPITSSNKNPVQTTAPIITTTPYIVNDVFADFSMVCDNVTCTYSLQSPALSEAWINELERSKNITNIDSQYYINDNSLLKDYQNQTDQLCNLDDYNKTYIELYQKFSNLQKDIDQFNELYKILNESYTNLTYYLNQFPAYNCYYYCKTFKPQTKITTIPPPSTTSFDPCSKQSCDLEVNGNSYKGQCVRQQTSAYCKCPGNLDPYNNCQNVGCYSTLNGKPDMLLNGPIWSPGYLGQVTSNTTYKNGLSCNWQITNTINIKNLSLSINSFKIADGSSLTVTSDIMSISFTNAYDIDDIKDTIQSIIGGASFIKIKFKSGTKVLPDSENYFDLYLSGTYPTIPTTILPTTQSFSTQSALEMTTQQGFTGGITQQSGSVGTTQQNGSVGTTQQSISEAPTTPSTSEAPTTQGTSEATTTK